jgi:thioredoxin reductase (NADPH)
VDLPVLLVVEADDDARDAAAAALRERCESGFEVRCVADAAAAAEAIGSLRRGDRRLAVLMVGDDAADAEERADLLGFAVALFPHARRVLLTVEPESAPAVGDVDAVLPRAWSEADTAILPALSDLIEEWQRSAQRSAPVVRVIGFQWSRRAHDAKDFLARNRVAYTWTDVDHDARARAEVERLGIPPGRLPLLRFPDDTHLLSPSDAEIAEKIGLSTEARSPFYDLVIVGAGPAGLAAAVYGASEGLRTLIVDRDAPGGQAGQSARIENYLGFPDGLSGGDLAQRAVAQARKFGVEILAAREARALRAEGPYRVVTLDDGDEIACHTVLLAMGVAWKTLDAPGCTGLVGSGVYYGAASAEAQAFRDRDVYLLGGGNSAGQAALLLARYARSVTMLALEDSLADRMSRYLLERIEQTPNIEARPCCTVEAATGKRNLETITIRNVQTDERETVPASGLFVFIGAAPETAWLRDVVALDADGQILCGSTLPRRFGRPRGWSEDREPFMLETSMPGVFAAGDVRAGAVKRVGAAVGEGSVAIQFIHEYVRQR